MGGQYRHTVSCRKEHDYVNWVQIVGSQREKETIHHIGSVFYTRTHTTARQKRRAHSEIHTHGLRVIGAT